MPGKRIAVYTCISGDYDPLRLPASVHRDIDYYCFTDSPKIVKSPWAYAPIDLPGLDARDQNRFIKMNPHLVLPEYEWTLYLDGSVQIVGDLGDFLSGALSREGDIFMYEHRFRQCTYDEAETCTLIGCDWVWNISAQMRRYRQEGLAANAGLFEAGVIVRRKCERTRVLMDAWWREYMGGVKRDQLSLSYVSSKLGIPVTSLGKSDPWFLHRYFNFIDHPRPSRAGGITRILVNRLVTAFVPKKSLFG